MLRSNEIDEYLKDDDLLIRKAANNIMVYNQDDFTRFQAERAEMKKGEMESLIEEAEKTGIDKGRKETLESNIKTMYSNGFNIETIAKALNLETTYVKQVLGK